MNKYTFIAGVALLASMAIAPAHAQKGADTLRWASTASITAVDPYSNAHREALIVNAQLVWDTLVHREPETGQYKPLLAKCCLSL